MIHKFAIDLAAALLLTNSSASLILELNPGLTVLSRLYIDFPSGVEGSALLLLRVGTGVLFMLYGYPKITHLQQWANALKIPIFCASSRRCPCWQATFA